MSHTSINPHPSRSHNSNSANHAPPPLQRSPRNTHNPLTQNQPLFVPPHLQRDLREQRHLRDLLTPTPGAGSNLLPRSSNTGENLSMYNTHFKPAGNSYTNNLRTACPLDHPGPAPQGRYESMDLTYERRGQTNSSDDGDGEDHHEDAALAIEVDHTALQQLFNLSDTKLGLAQEILEMNQQDIMGALVYGILAIKPAPAAVAPVPEGALIAVDICNFLFSDYIKAHIAGLPIHIENQHLPVGYTHRPPSPHAQQLVLGLIRELLKNIVYTSFHKVNGPAPSLEVLYNVVNQGFFARTGVHIPPVNWSTLPLAGKFWFAYTILEAAVASGRLPKVMGVSGLR
ncbi:hypothetical protein PSHT_14947 [Puccinia striiformis]|uniref:Uncharacterized protein n=1 Tax=Puccinia striiformis TaxID=27350 RepID=A0A2S4UHI6_9BASI|nr:hypothetical protein PSHT_14947 [Puccinia striiformis]